MSIDAAVFDVDGTIATCPYDFDAMRAAVADVAARYGLDTKSLGVHGVIEQITTASEMLREVGAEFAQAAEAAVRAVEVAAAPSAEVLPQASEALAAFRQNGIRIALITRNCRAAAEIVLRSLDAYDVLLTRDDVPLTKPNPDHVLRAIHSLGSTPDRTIVVGDHDYDIKAGRAARVRFCIGVLTGGNSADQLTKVGADAIIDSVGDLPAWLRERGAMDS